MVRERAIQKIFRNRTPVLLASVVVLQVLDWHSTLSAGRGRLETNRLLVWLGQRASFLCVVSAIKVIFIAVLVGGFLYWRKHKGVYELEYTACLSVLVVAYGVVVVSNYLA